MSIEINGEIFYMVSEICRNVGISRSTLIRWIEKGIVKSSKRDRRGWRLFSENDLMQIRGEAFRTTSE